MPGITHNSMSCAIILARSDSSGGVPGQIRRQLACFHAVRVRNEQQKISGALKDAQTNKYADHRIQPV